MIDLLSVAELELLLLRAQLRGAQAEVRRLKELALGLAERVVAQAEILSRNAERGPHDR